MFFIMVLLAATLSLDNAQTKLEADYYDARALLERYCIEKKAGQQPPALRLLLNRVRDQYGQTPIGRFLRLGVAP
jgi:hypothetical protein